MKNINSIDGVGNNGERTAPDNPKAYEFERIYKYIGSIYGGKNKSVLDYGCGTGYGSNILANYFATITGIDVDQHAVDFCEKTYSKNNLSFSMFLYF